MDIKPFQFFLPTNVSFGVGVTRSIGELCAHKRVMVVTTGLKRSGILNRIIREAGTPADLLVFDEIEPNPTCESVDRGGYLARINEIEVVIALGGGSALDAAKAVACLRDEREEIVAASAGIRSYLLGERAFSRRSTQLIAIPTTSGTGSEVTNVAVFSDPVNHYKKSMVSPWFWNDYAFVDPELTVTVPEKHTAATGLDALVHAIESFWAVSSTPFSEPIALEAVKLIMDHLLRAYHNPEDIGARTKVSLGSMMAGIAFSQTRTTILHALSYPLTVDFHLEHGFACSVLLKPMLQTNAPLIPKKVARLLDYLEAPSLERLLQRIEELMVSVDAPVRLKALGVQEKDLEGIADQALRSPLTKLNPKAFTLEELIAWLKENR